MMRSSYANVVQGVGSSRDVNSVLHTACDEEEEVMSENDKEEQKVNVDSQYNTLTVDNNSHPLYIHNNDHPGLVLIAKKLVGNDNYAPWSRSMQIALNARNKFVIVTGSYRKPDVKSPLFAQWERVNDLIITWILNSVAEEISDGLNYVTTASEVWKELHERFSGVNGHRIFQVLKDIHSLEQGNKSVEVYFHKLKGLWDEYSVLEPSVNCVCGAHKVQIERDQKGKLLQFLLGLHDSNSNVRGQILLMNPLPTVSQAYAFVRQDEKARQGFHRASIDASPIANVLVPAQGSVTVAAASSGFKKFNANFGVVKTPVKCSFCNFNGHTRENCYKLIGYPPNWKKKKDVVSSGTGNGQQVSASQFRPLPKSNQANAAVTDYSSNDQLTQMQNQINQLMSLFVGSRKASTSPEDHLAGIYIGSNGCLVTEVIQISRKFGHWPGDDGLDDLSKLEPCNYVEVVKLTGDPDVPAGQVAFRAKVGGKYKLPPWSVLEQAYGAVARYKGEGRLSGFQESKWIDAEIFILGEEYRKEGFAIGFLFPAPDYYFMKLFKQLRLESFSESY